MSTRHIHDHGYSNRTAYGIESEPLRYVWAGYHLFIILSSLLGDTTILIASIKYKAFKLNKVMVVIIQHIAVCDMMVTATRAIPMFFSAAYNEWIFGNFLCYSNTYTGYYLYLTSLLLICNMTTTKLLTLKYPFLFRTITSKKAHLFCLACWTIALTLPVMYFLADKDDIFFSYRIYMCDYGFSSEIWYYLLPIISIVFVFIPTCHVVVTTIYVLVLARRGAPRGRKSLKWQGIMTTVLVAAVYCLSVLPYGVYRFGESFFDQDDENKTFFLTTYSRVADSFLYINTISNFYIYSLTVHSFRKFLWSRMKPSYEFLSSIGTASISLGEATFE
jgi:hypothetical protein